MVKDDVGRYHAVLTADVVGVWGCEVIGSGTVNAVDFWQLTVDPAPF